MSISKHKVNRRSRLIKICEFVRFFEYPSIVTYGGLCMLYFLLGCFVSGDLDKEQVHLTLDKVSLYECADTSPASYRSTLKIATLKDSKVIGHGTGGYFRLGKHRFVLTAAHVAVSEYEVKLQDGDRLVGARLIYADLANDIAIFLPDEELLEVEAMHWRVNSNDDLLGESTVYSGYPSELGKLLFRGMVSAVNEDGSLIVQSFALPGSSGSVLFDSRGRVLGVVSAIMLNQTPFSPYPNFEENVVYVSRVDFIDKEFIKEVIRCGTE